MSNQDALVTALKAWLKPWDGWGPIQLQRRADPATIARIKQTREALALVSDRTLASPDEIAEANSVHGSEEIRFDADAEVSHAENGYWVQGWCWVGQEESKFDMDKEDWDDPDAPWNPK